MKTISIIAFLSAKESQFVLDVLGKTSINKGLKIFLFIQKKLEKGQLLDKKKLYRAVYGENYQDKKDHRLRNDLRQLNAIMKNAVVDYLRIEQKKYLEENEVLWLNRILQTKNFAFFEKEWRAIEREQQKKRNYEGLTKIGNLYYDYLNEYSEISVNKYKDLNRLAEKVIGYKKMTITEELRKLEVKKKYAERVIKAIDPSFVFSSCLETIDLKQISEEEEILRYFTLRGESYILDGREKIVVLKELIELYPIVVINRPEIEDEIFPLLGAIALEHFFIADYEKADEYYTIIFATYKKKHRKPRLDIVFNYVSNLFKNGNFEKVIETILKNYRAIKKNPRTRYRMEFFLVLSYLELGENEQAYKELHIDIHKRPQSEYHSFQLCYIIYYYQTKNQLLFENTVTSFYNRVINHPPIGKEYTYMAYAFKKLLQATNLFSAKRKKKLLSLKEDITKYEGLCIELKDFSINTWLKKELERLMEKSS